MAPPEEECARRRTPGGAASAERRTPRGAATSGGGSERRAQEFCPGDVSGKHAGSCAKGANCSWLQWGAGSSRRCGTEAGRRRRRRRRRRWAGRETDGATVSAWWPTGHTQVDTTTEPGQRACVVWRVVGNVAPQAPYDGAGGWVGTGRGCRVAWSAVVHIM